MRLNLRNRERRKEYLLAQALVYLTSGLFLITYASEVQARSFILLIGIILCVFSFINVIVVTFIPKCINKMEVIDTYIKTGLLPITFAALFIGVIGTKDKGFFELRLLMTFSWVLIAILSMSVSLFRAMSFRINAGSGVRGFFYKIFVFLGLFSSLLGLFFVMYGAFDPETAKVLVSFNKWLYDPMVWFAIAILCVFPILILTPNEADEDDKL